MTLGKNIGSNILSETLRMVTLAIHRRIEDPLVGDIEAANGGRHKFKGKVDRTSVPKQELRNNGAGNTSAKP